MVILDIIYNILSTIKHPQISLETVMPDLQAGQAALHINVHLLFVKFKIFEKFIFSLVHRNTVF